jgi:hypothetical protein
MVRAHKAIWSCFVGSISYRDVVGVSRTATPSIALNHEMVDELKGTIKFKELLLLKKYANRLICTAYSEQKRMLGKTEMSLFKAFYWKSDFIFCFFWTSFLLLPQTIIDMVKNFRRKLK